MKKTAIFRGFLRVNCRLLGDLSPEVNVLVNVHRSGLETELSPTVQENSVYIYSRVWNMNYY